MHVTSPLNLQRATKMSARSSGEGLNDPNMDTPVVPFRCALPSTSGLNNPEGLEASSSPVDKAPPKRPRHLRGTTWHLWLVYINVALYALCYMAQVPVLPYLVKSYGAESSTYGYLMTCFGILQFFGGLAAGPILDVFGGHFVFFLSFLCSAASYGTVAFSSGIFMLYISKIPTAMQHAVMAARALVSRESDPKDRSRVLGRVAVAYSVGFAVGPMAGGAISNTNLKNGAMLATAGSLISAAMVWLLIPTQQQAESPGLLHKSDDAVEEKSPQENLADRVRDMWAVCLLPTVPSILIVKLFVTLAFALFHSTFTLALQDTFGLEPKDNGMILSYTGLLTIVAQGLVVDWATQRFEESQLVRWCVWFLVPSFLAMAAATTVGLLMVALVPLVTGAMLVTTVNTAQATKAVPATHTGTILAVEMSIGSGVRVLSPTIGTFLLGRYGFGSIGLSAAALLAVLLALIHLGAVTTSTQEAPSQTHRRRDGHAGGGRGGIDSV